MSHLMSLLPATPHSPLRVEGHHPEFKSLPPGNPGRPPRLTDVVSGGRLPASQRD